jgi:hypothetical protein
MRPLRKKILGDQCFYRNATGPLGVIQWIHHPQGGVAVISRGFSTFIISAGLVAGALASAGQAGADPVYEDLGGSPASSTEVDGSLSGDILQPSEYNTTAMPSDIRGPNMSAAPQFTAG